MEAAATPLRRTRVHTLLGRLVVVTAGPTYEDIDDVRYIGNRSSGRMGYALAAAAERVRRSIKAREEIPDFTGIGQPYEEPESPDLEVGFGEPLEDAAERVLAALRP